MFSVYLFKRSSNDQMIGLRLCVLKTTTNKPQTHITIIKPENQLIHMLLTTPEPRAKISLLICTWLWDSVPDGCFYVTSDGGSLWWIIDNRLRAVNSAFMTDNKCALPNQANWSVPFWNGKRKRKEFIGENFDIVSTLYYAPPPCKITAMNLLKNQTRYFTHLWF